MISAGSRPASSNARATPTSETAAPPPPEDTSATRLPASAGNGRSRKGGNTRVWSVGSRRSISGSGSSARRARRKKPISPASAPTSSTYVIRSNWVLIA